MLNGERVFPPEWETVKAALRAGYRPPLHDPVPPPPVSRRPVVEPGDAWEEEDGTDFTLGDRGWEVRPGGLSLPDGVRELEAVRRCVQGPLKGIDTND